ncbi:hypothetical protein [Streptomyces sp. NPDC001401]|uniref:hypothetical protein n=1 Tax=Streptomyces sp. NPDC001401 TaxID=3364570 RepID=UPI00368F888E
MPDTNQPQRPDDPKARMIETRVCIDDTFGPYDAKLDPTNRWKGWLCPFFTLGTVRKLAARTQEMASEYGYDNRDTVHVIDGGTDGESGAIVLLISWQHLDQDAESDASIIQPNDEGRYGIGGGQWTWHFASWWCACGSDMPWHVTDCEGCDLSRDTQPEKKPCDCGCDPQQGVFGEYDLKSAVSQAHFLRTGRFLRWSEQPDAQPSL